MYGYRILVNGKYLLYNVLNVKHMRRHAMIRKYQNSDSEFVQKLDVAADLEIKYHNDVDKDNIYTYVDDGGEILGVLYFKYHTSWYWKSGINRIVVNIVWRPMGPKSELARDEIIEYAKRIFKVMKKSIKGKNMCLCVGLDDTEYENIQFYLSHGFYEAQLHPCLLYNLEDDIPSCEAPEGMAVQPVFFGSAQMSEYIKATSKANNSCPFSVNEIWFMTGDESFKTFMLKNKGEIVAGVSIRRINRDRSEIENIFVLPEYKHGDIKRYMISYILDFQRNLRYTMSTITIKANDIASLRLYENIGFELYYNKIELRYT